MRGQLASRSGGAHGGPEWALCGAELERGVPFDRPVTQGGYLWWYLDGLSDDGQWAITLIAFVGTVFSPAYFRARARSGGGEVVDRIHAAGARDA